MAKKKKASARPLGLEVLAAVEASAAGVEDGEGRSPAVILAERVTAGKVDITNWKAELVAAVKLLPKGQGDLWREFEFLVSMTEGWTSSLADALETALVEADTVSRASIYSLLAGCERSVSPASLQGDVELKEQQPLLWFDLLLPMLPLVDRQQLFLSAIQSGVIGPKELSHRLNEVRLAAGAQLGDWLEKLREVFPAADQRNVEDIFRQVGFVPPRATVRIINAVRKNLAPAMLGIMREWGARASQKSSRYDRCDARIS